MMNQKCNADVKAKTLRKKEGNDNNQRNNFSKPHTS